MLLQKQIDDLKEELSIKYCNSIHFYKNLLGKTHKLGIKQLFISQNLARQQNEMNELRSLLSTLRFQTETFPLFFIPIARMFNPLNHNHNIDDLSYEVSIFYWKKIKKLHKINKN